MPCYSCPRRHLRNELLTSDCMTLQYDVYDVCGVGLQPVLQQERLRRQQLHSIHQYVENVKVIQYIFLFPLDFISLFISLSHYLTLYLSLFISHFIYFFYPYLSLHQTLYLSLYLFLLSFFLYSIFIPSFYHRNLFLFSLTLALSLSFISISIF